MRTALLLLLILLLPTFGATAADLTTAAGFQKTCSSAPYRNKVTNKQQAQVFVICNDVLMVRHALSFYRNTLDRWENHFIGSRKRWALINSELIYLKSRIEESAEVLEAISKDQHFHGMLLDPSAWAMDLDGDGRIDVWERHFFAIPRRGESALKVGMPATDPAYYREHYRQKALFRVDTTDVYWALSYHYFAAGLIEMVLSYTMIEDPDEHRSFELILASPDGMRKAHKLLSVGLQTSKKFREELVKERDNNLEWIGHVRQTNSVFPVAIDDADIAAWAEAISLIIPLLEGKTLLAPAKGSRGILDFISEACPEEMGIHIPSLFQKPPRNLFTLLDKEVRKTYCLQIDQDHPASQLSEFLREYSKRADQESEAAMRFMRRLIWVN